MDKTAVPQAINEETVPTVITNSPDVNGASLPTADLALPTTAVESEEHEIRNPGAGAAVTEARPMVLVRYRPGVTGQTTRIVHLVPLPTDGQAGAVSALCGARLSRHDIETVIPGQGMPCRGCIVSHITTTASTGKPPRPIPTVRTPQGWPRVESPSRNGAGR